MFKGADISRRVWRRFRRRLSGTQHLGEGRLRQMFPAGDDVTERLFLAFSEFALGKMDAAHADVIKKVELGRSALNTSHQPLVRIDYGTGAGDFRADAAANATGMPVHTTVGKLCRGSSKPSNWARLLFHFTHAWQPNVALELGCCLGVSAAYQAAALPKEGKLYTIEGAPAVAELARQNLNEWGVGHSTEVLAGSFAGVLPGLLPRIGPVDYAFIDGHHSEEATKYYFTQLVPFLSPVALLVLDDIDRSAGMQRAWEYVRSAEGVRLSVETDTLGIAVWQPSYSGPRVLLDIY